MQIWRARQPVDRRNTNGLMSINNSWMSCRAHPSSRASSSTTGGGISLLPQFAAPPGVHDFAIESRPPQLPSRNSPLRLLGIFVVGVFCLAGVCAVGGAAVEPLRANGGYLSTGMRTAVSTAITKAHEAAERNAREHYAARAEYLHRRGLRRLDDSGPGNHMWTGRPRPQEPATAPATPEQEEEEEPGESESVAQSEDLLLRLAALRARTNAIDDNAVQQYFPTWKSTTGAWKEHAVLHDLVLAVSQLAYRSTVGTGAGAPPSARRPSRDASIAKAALQRISSDTTVVP